MTWPVRMSLWWGKMILWNVCVITHAIVNSLKFDNIVCWVCVCVCVHACARSLVHYLYRKCHGEERWPWNTIYISYALKSLEKCAGVGRAVRFLVVDTIGKEERPPQISSGWSSTWFHSNTGLSSTQYEQISIVFGVWPFWLNSFFFRSITFWWVYS